MTFVNKLFEKYKKLPLAAKASMWFVVCSVLQKGISVITTPIFTRILSQEDYGTISVYNTWLSIITIFATLELSSGVFNKAMVKYSHDRNGYTASCLFISSIITLCLFGFYYKYRDLFNGYLGLDTKYVVLMFISIFFTTAISLFCAKLRFTYRYLPVVIITVSTSILSTISSLLFVLNTNTEKAFARILGSLIVTSIIYSVIFVKIFIEGKKIVQKESVSFTLRNGIYLVPHYLSQIILNESDRIMIDKYCGKVDTANYTLAYQMAIMMRFLTDAIHASFVPWTFQNMETKNYQTIGKRAFQIELFIGLACSLFALFGPEFIWLMGGKNYSGSVYVVPPVAMSVLLITLYSFFGNIEFYFEETKLISFASILIAALNVGLNFVFIKLYGYVAAGYTTLACYTIYTIVHYLFMLRILKKNQTDNPYNGKLMFLTAVFFIGISIGISFLYRFSIVRYVLIAVLVPIIIIYLIKNKENIVGKKNIIKEDTYEQ